MRLEYLFRGKYIFSCSDKPLTNINDFITILTFQISHLADINKFLQENNLKPEIYGHEDDYTIFAVTTEDKQIIKRLKKIGFDDEYCKCNNFIELENPEKEKSIN